MTKIYEALQQAEEQRSRQGRSHRQSGPRMVNKSLEDKFLALANRLERYTDEKDRGLVVQLSSVLQTGDNQRIAYQLAQCVNDNKSSRTLLIHPTEAPYMAPDTPCLQDVMDSPGWADDLLQNSDANEPVLLKLSDQPKALLPLLSSEAFEEALDTVRAAFDFIIIDAPPLCDSALCGQMAYHSSGVVLIIEAGKQRWQSLQSELDVLRSQGANLLGFIFTRQQHHIPNWIYRRL